jgi:flagellar motor protein MotB
MVARNVLLALVLGLGILCAAGCQESVAKADFDALKKHNATLMDENNQIRKEWEQAKIDAELQRQRDAQLAATPPPPPDKTNSQMMDEINRKLPKGATMIMRDNKPVIRIDGALVNYGSGKASLTPEGKQAMDRVALILNRDFAGRKVVVEGHTDSDPILRTKNLYNSNWELGMKRATEVVHYLEIKGVDSKRMSATSFGEQQPIADNGSSAGKAKNRRVEIVVAPDDASVPTPTAMN